jgi:hypothetical protein
MRVYTVEFRVSGNTWVVESVHSTPSAALAHLADIIDVLPGGSFRLSQRVES